MCKFKLGDRTVRLGLEKASPTDMITNAVEILQSPPYRYLFANCKGKAEGELDLGIKGRVPITFNVDSSGFPHPGRIVIPENHLR